MGNKFSEHRKYCKALETVVYLANKDTRQYWVLKAIYLADKEHLSKYGRQIFGDRYIAMQLGPVPSLAYDIVKSVRKSSDTYYYFPDPTPGTALQLVDDNRTVKAARKANRDIFSASEIACLDRAYETIKGLSIEEIKKLTHDDAYHAAQQDDEMEIEKVIGNSKNKEEVFDYLSA